MAIKITRDMLWNSFTTQDIAKYLAKEFYDDDFLVMAQPESTENSIMAAFGGTNFLICANKVQRFEIACHYRFEKKIKDVIEAIKKWNRFNGPHFLVEYVDEKKKTYHVFFENGSIPPQAYLERFEGAYVSEF